MTRIIATLAAIGVGVWVLAHVFFTGPVENTSEVAAVWTFGIAAASFVVAAVVLLAVGMALGRTRPTWLGFVAAARTIATVVGAALIIAGILRYRDTEPHGEIYWLVLGLVVLLGAGVVHLWLAHARRRELA